MGGGAGVFRSIPHLTGLLGCRQRELFPKKSPLGDLATTRREFGDRGSCPSTRPARLTGHPPVSSLLFPHLPSPLAAAPRTVARPGPHPFSVPLLRSLTWGTRCPVHLAGIDPAPQILIEGLGLDSLSLGYFDAGLALASCRVSTALRYPFSQVPRGTPSLPTW